MNWAFVLMMIAGSPLADAHASGNHDESSDGNATTRPADVEVDEALIRRLLGSEPTTLDAVERVLDRMERSSDRLTKEFDPGSDTQTAQAEVLAALDELIADAEKSRLESRGQPKRKRRDTSPPDRRARRSTGDGRSGRSPTPTRHKGDSEHGAGADAKKLDDASVEIGRGWGYLPDRDRREIRQGFDEEFMPKFREQILDYYRALARKAAEE